MQHNRPQRNTFRPVLRVEGQEKSFKQLHYREFTKNPLSISRIYYEFQQLQSVQAAEWPFSILIEPSDDFMSIFKFGSQGLDEILTAVIMATRTEANDLCEN